jgi:hypothetical protein
MLKKGLAGESTGFPISEPDCGRDKDCHQLLMRAILKMFYVCWKRAGYSMFDAYIWILQQGVFSFVKHDRFMVKVRPAHWSRLFVKREPTC